MFHADKLGEIGADNVFLSYGDGAVARALAQKRFMDYEGRGDGGCSTLEVDIRGRSEAWSYEVE